MATADRPYTMRPRTRTFASLNTIQKMHVVLRYGWFCQDYHKWSAKNRGSDWARVKNTLERFIYGSSDRYSIHE